MNSKDIKSFTSLIENERKDGIFQDKYLFNVQEHECTEDFIFTLLPDTGHGGDSIRGYPGRTYTACEFCYGVALLFAGYMVIQDGHDGFFLTRPQEMNTQ